MDSPPLNRRSSVFSDLLTVFRKNTMFPMSRRSIYHAPPINRSSIEAAQQNMLLPNQEADAFGDGEAKEEEDAEEKRNKPLTRQYLLNKIRQKKEVINKLRCQPWSMNRKRRTLRLAQKYLEQNESKVSRAHLYKEELVKRWRSFLRWASNIGIYLIPWESKIKKIESQFGSVVSSYFTFLRWVIFMNLILTLIIATLIVIPEFIADATADAARRNRTFTRKEIPAEEKPHADEIQVVWHYGGYLRYSPLFYGYYANEHVVGEYFSYPIPLAYFLGTLVVFACSFIAILRKMASNARMSKLAGSKTEQYIFNWKVFTGWDYSIGNSETASNTAMAAVIKLRETINECHAEQSKRIRPVQVIIRIVTNLVILAMIAFSIYCIHAAVQSSEAVEQTGSGSLLTKNQELDEGVLFPKSSIVPSVVSTITHVFPIIFDLIGKIEKHHPKMQLRLHLFRFSVLTLYVINYATLIFALFEKLDNIRDITRTFDEDERRPRRVRTIFRTTPPMQSFLSRNFSNEAQFRARVRHGMSLASSVVVSAERIPRRRDEYAVFLKRFLTTKSVVDKRAFTGDDSDDHESWRPVAGRKTKLESWSRRKRQAPIYPETNRKVDFSDSPNININFFVDNRPNDYVSDDDDNSDHATVNSGVTPGAAFFSASLSASSASSSTSLSTRSSSLLSSSSSVPTSTVTSARTSRIGSSLFYAPSSSPYISSSTSSAKARWRSSSSSSPKTSTTKAADASVVTVDGSRVTINAQFGPVGVNNPTVLMRNATAAPTTISYETRRLGPTPLPVFTPPPLPPTESQPTFRKHDWGPDWSVSTKERTEFPSISFGDVVKLDTVPYSELNDKDLHSGEGDKEYGNGSTLAIISSEVGDQGHYNDHICWETVIGQEIVKLVTMDLYYTIVSILVIDFFRGYWIRYCSSWWCWDIETTFPEYGEFKVAENVLHIINNQGMIWLGLFFAPFLPAVNNVKLIIIMYIRAWACMTCNVPAREIFRASRSSNFFLMILLLWLLLCTLPVGYVITSKRPSTICGPFAGKDQFYEVITKIIEANVSKKVIRWLKYIASPGVIIPIILLLMLIIFFLVSLVRGLREANTDLQKQLVHERTEEKKKIFELAGGGKQKKPSGSFFSKFQPKKPVQHLPEVEQKRREPWRQYNGTDRAASLCPSDELVSSQQSENSGSPLPPSSRQPPQIQTMRSTSDASDQNTEFSTQPPPRSVYAFRPSLGVSTSSNFAADGKSARSASGYKLSSASKGGSAHTDRPDDPWLPENEATHSGSESDDVAVAGDVPPGQPAASTPDDLRKFILPFLEPRKFHAGDSVTSLAAFPKDASNPIIFGTCIAAIGGSGSAQSRRSSTAMPSNASYASLYENSQPHGSPPDGVSVSESGAISQYNPRYSKVWRHQYSLATSPPSGPPSSPASAISVGHYSTMLRANRNEMTSGAVNSLMPRSGTFPSGFAATSEIAAAMARSFVAHPHASTIPPGGQPAPETQQRISIYAKEPRRLGQMCIQQTALSGSRINTFVNVHAPAARTNRIASTATNQNESRRKATDAANTQQISCRDTVDSKRQDKNHHHDSSLEAEPSTSTQKLASPPKTRSPSKIHTPTDTAETFMPWPSIEEVKAQRSNFFKNQNKHKEFVRLDSQHSPSKLMTKSAYGALERPNRMPFLDIDQDSQPTRFRISVSPTRRLRPGYDSSNSEEDENDNTYGKNTGSAKRSGSKPGFIVKQQLMPGSTSSFGSRLSTETTAALKAEVAAQAAARMAAATASANSSRRQAPKIEFGEDDSPRVELPPNM